MTARLDVDEHFLELSKMAIERTGLASHLIVWQRFRAFEPDRKRGVSVILAFAVGSRKSEQKRAIFGNAALRE